MKILIIGSPKLPIPPTLGGGVPTLLYNGLALQNERLEGNIFYFVSPFDPKAKEQGDRLIRSKFIYAHFPAIPVMLDRFLAWFFGKLLRRKRTMSLSYINRTLWYNHFVKKVLLQGDYDKVVVENSIPVLRCFKPRRIKKQYQGKLFFHSHSFIRRFYGAKKVFLFCNKIFVVSEFMKNDLLKNKDLLPIKNKIEVLKNKVELSSFFSPASEAWSIRAKIGASPSDFLVLFVGRFTKEKGISELLDAFSLIPDPQIKLVIVGSYFYNSGIASSFEIEMKKKALQLGNRAIFTGYVSQEELIALYQQSDVCALPSTWDEPAGVTMIEALAAGCPLITTRSGGIPEYMGQNNCILLDLNSNLVRSMADSIVLLKNDLARRMEMSKRGQLQAKTLTIESYLPDFLKRIQ